MTKKNSVKDFRKYLIPSLLSMLVVSAYTFTDTFVVGQELGASGLAAIGIATPVLTTLFALGFLFGAGGGAAYAVTKGKGDYKKASEIYTHSIILAVITGLLINVLGNIFIYDIARFLGATSDNIDQAAEYMRWLFVFAPFLILDLTTNNFMRNDEQPKVAMTATIIGSGTNIVLDCLFVFVFKWGMFGAAIATCLGSVIAVIVNISYSTIKKLNLRFCKIKPSFNISNRIISNGVGPFILNFSVSVVTFFYISVCAKHYGEIGVSSYVIIMNWNIICMNLLIGVAQAAQPLISLSYGKGEKDQVKLYNNMAMKTALIMSIIFLPFAYLMPEQLANVFVKDNVELVALTVSAIKLVAPTYLFMGLTIVLGYYFEAIEFPKQSLAIMFARGFVFPIIFLYGLSIGFGDIGIWLSLCIGEIASLIVALIIKKFTKVHKENENVPYVPLVENDNLIITISREFASGGREIGKAISEKLNIPFYDKNVNELTSIESGIPADLINQIDEQKETDFMLGLNSNNKYRPISNQVYFAQSKVIEQIAKRGSAVIVGRCADSVLHGKSKCLNIFIHAPLEARVKRVIEFDNCSEKVAVQKIIQSDKVRSNYYNFYAGTEWGKAQNYHLCINSSLGIDLAINNILNLVKQINV